MRSADDVPADHAPPLSITPYTEEEPLLAATRSDAQPRVQVSRPPGAVVVLGRSSQPSVELRTDHCAADAIPLQRRRGGGCAVVLDPGNVVVTATASAPGLRIADHFARLSAWLTDGLVQAGVPGVTRQDMSDLCLGDRKIAGACMYRARDALLYSVSLLVDPDLSLLYRYLRHPPREPSYRQGRRHRDFVTTIHHHTALTATQLTERLATTLKPPRL